MRRLILALLALVAVSCSSDPVELSGYERLPTPSVAAASLPEPGQGEFSFVAEDQHILLVYFGYTACPDVCPTTLSDVGRAIAMMGDEGERVDLAMITIDPNRDTDEIVTGYVESFLDRAHGLRTDDDSRLREVADLFGADYVVNEIEGSDPEVGHTDSLYAVDDNGDMVLTWWFGTKPEAIASDLSVLLDR